MFSAIGQKLLNQEGYFSHFWKNLIAFWRKRFPPRKKQIRGNSPDGSKLKIAEIKWNISNRIYNIGRRCGALFFLLPMTAASRHFRPHDPLYLIHPPACPKNGHGVSSSRTLKGTKKYQPAVRFKSKIKKGLCEKTKLHVTSDYAPNEFLVSLKTACCSTSSRQKRIRFFFYPLLSECESVQNSG